MLKQLQHPHVPPESRSHPNPTLKTRKRAGFQASQARLGQGRPQFGPREGGGNVWGQSFQSGRLADFEGTDSPSDSRGCWGGEVRTAPDRTVRGSRAQRYGQFGQYTEINLFLGTRHSKTHRLFSQPLSCTGSQHRRLSHINKASSGKASRLSSLLVGQPSQGCPEGSVREGALGQKA